ncbi:hypothetical protein C0989_005349 [Termitomyces sp. Mn162]|nr:hypothetical protein C0989_005349 [Termitomyces sp. Mn162]
MTGRAKWDAWNSASKNYTSVDDAENRYLDIAKSLGWVEGTATVPSQTEQSDPDSIWDDDSQTTQGGGASGGMGGTVSTMMISAADTDESLHGLAVSNDITALSELFQNHPEMDVNQFDEFVRYRIHPSEEWQLMAPGIYTITPCLRPRKLADSGIFTRQRC